MKTIYQLVLLPIYILLVSINANAQSLVAVGNTNFPINDNTSIAPVSAINSGWQINGIGKIIKIVPHPSVAATLYACSASGGIFFTTNSGTSWSPITGSFLPGVQFGSLAIDPTNPQVMYAGSGEPTYAQTYGWGGFGLFKSTNGGSTWTQMNNTMGNVVVSDIIINPSNTQEVVACCSNGIYKTTNGAGTWTNTLSAPGQWIQQVLRQGAGLTLVAIGNSRFYRSTDFGNTWTTTDLDPAFSATFSNGRIAVAPSNSLIVYAGWVNNSFSSCNNACIFYSNDGGLTFTKKYAFANSPKLISYDGVSATGYGWANFFIMVSSSDPNTLYTGGHLIYKSTDNGASWSAVLSQWWCCTHTDIHQLMYDPANINRLLNANDGGVFVSTDLGVSWSPISNGLYCNQYESMAQSNIDPGFVVGGLQDNGIIYKNTDGNYHTYTGGDLTDHMTCDYTNSYNVYTSNSGGKVYNPYNRSQSAALALPASVASGSRPSFFISSLNPAIGYGWGTNVWRSSNVNSYNLAGGTSSVAWTQISFFSVTIQDVKTSPASDDVLYAITNNATIYKSQNATAASPIFTPVTLPAGSFTNVAASLTVSKLNPNVVYVTANNQVFRSADAGLTWTNYTATGLPAINFQKIFTDPYSTIESVYLVTSLGIYYRDLTMAAWVSVNTPLTSPPQNITANYAGLIVGTSMYKGAGSSSSHISFATWGSGIWKTTFYDQQNSALTGGYTNTDIGAPAISGSGFYDNTKHNYNLSGAGSGINAATTDQFNFTNVAITGNSDIITKVYSVAETDPVNGLSKTGLMLRSSTAANSPYVMISCSGHAGVLFQYRANAGDVSTVTAAIPAPAVAYPLWLRLNKNVANLVTSYISTDGTTWTPVGNTTVNLGTNFRGGIAVTSNNTAANNNSSVSDISLNGFTVLATQNIVLHATLKDQNTVALAWSFDTDERNNTGVVERSTDGITFYTVSNKEYRNELSTMHTFNDASTDPAPAGGWNYYRLKLLLQNGQVKYSNIDRVMIKDKMFVKIDPNPASENGMIRIIISGAPPAARIIFSIHDIMGRVLASRSILNNGNSTILNPGLAAGTYLYRAICNDEVISGKFVVE